MKQRGWNYQERWTTFFFQSRMLQSFQFHGSKKLEQHNWKYHERWKFPLPVKNTATVSALRKRKNQTTQLEIPRTLENISSVSQQYYDLFNFKEATKWNNVAGSTGSRPPYVFVVNNCWHKTMLKSMARIEEMYRETLRRLRFTTKYKIYSKWFNKS